MFYFQTRTDAFLQHFNIMRSMAADKRRQDEALSSPSAPAPAAAAAEIPTASRLTLERVLGVTSLSNAMVAVNPATGETAYAAGCIVVIYNLRRNKQVRYYRVEKSVACLCFSPSGQFLAIGEKGYVPAITIWDGADGTLRAELQRHKFGVACMAFSRDGRFLLSAGLVHDQHLFVWDLREAMRDGAGDSDTGKTVGVAEVHEKILAMDYCQEGNFFVTVGEKHFKFWFLDDQDQFLLTGYEINGVPEIQHRDAVMSAKSDATFTGVACGFGTCKLKTFAVTSDGTLCCFGASCIMERLVSLEAAHGSAISVTEAYVAVAGSSSIVRLFDPSTLEYRSTMPFPPPLGKANEPNDASSNILHPDEPHRYPAVIAVRVTGSHVIVLYSDRSLFIYDVSDIQNARVEQSFMCHSGCIRDLKVAGRVRGLNSKGRLVYTTDEGRRSGATLDVVPNGTIVTCSDDNTMRLWHLDLHKQARSSSGRFSGRSETLDASVWKNPHSQEMLWVAYHDHERDFADEDAVVLGGTCSYDHIPDIHSPAQDHGQVNGLHAVDIHPNQTQVVAGDKEGNIVVLQLPKLGETRDIGAHNTEVHCIAFSSGIELEGSQGARGSSPCLMASGGRDRLVHVYDCSKEHSVLATLENHSGAVTSLQFTRDGKKLLSCGADKSIVVSDVSLDGKVSRRNSIPFVGGKIFDMTLTSNDEYLVTSCNNRLDIHNVNTCKQIKSHHVGEQHRINVCPANFCVAMSGSLSDKTIHIVDIATGETLADATGHGEAITAVKFTPDCRRLVSASSDGCIFVWRLSEEIQSAIKSRLPRVTEFQALNPAPPPAATKVEPVAQAPLMPPPAPPAPAPKMLRIPQPVPLAKPRSALPDSPQTSEASPAKKLPNNRTSASSPTTPPSTLPKKSDAKEAKGWKTKAAAPAPGPMANIPMEEWMRTRQSAKKTVHVVADTAIDDAAFEQQVMESSVHLAIDRSQTPDWARTVKPSDSKKIVKTGQPRIDQRRVAGAKWGKQAGSQPFVRESLDDDADHEDLDGDLSGYQDTEDDENDENEAQLDEPLFIKQQSGEVHQLDIPRSKEVSAVSNSRRNSASGAENVMNLSIGSLDIKALGATGVSSSLALEREQLEKRKKQIDTANAVAAMNSKLLQLGLLKPSKTLPDDSNHDNTESVAKTQNEQASVEIGTSAVPENADEMPSVLNGPDLATRGTSASIKIESEQQEVAAPVRRADIPEELLQSIDISALPAVRGDLSDTGTPEQQLEGMSSPRVDASLSAFTAGFQIVNNGSRDKILRESVDVATAATVNASISAFTAGYTSNCGVDSSARVSQSISLPSVSASLSAFTPGYSVASQGISAELSTPPRVDQSLSAFTSGFRAEVGTAARDDASRMSIDVSTGVNASISSFTSGYASNEAPRAVPVNESVSMPSVSASLSTFTSGYNPDDTLARSPSDTRSSGSLVAASLSAFTSGYEHVPTVKQAASPDKGGLGDQRGGGVTESLSAFTSGYTVTDPSVSQHEPSGSERQVGASFDAAVDQSLSIFTAGYGVRSDDGASYPATKASAKPGYEPSSPGTQLAVVSTAAISHVLYRSRSTQGRRKRPCCQPSGEFPRGPNVQMPSCDLAPD